MAKTWRFARIFELLYSLKKEPGRRGELLYSLKKEPGRRGVLPHHKPRLPNLATDAAKGPQKYSKPVAKQ
jgi:hypothetical protein